MIEAIRYRMDSNITLAQNLELQRTKAMVEADVSYLATIFSDALSYGHSSSVIDDKSAMLDKISTGAYNYLSVETKILSATISSGQLLIIMGNVEIDVILNGKHRIMDSVYVVVYEKDELNWNFLSHQTGFIKDLI